MNEINLRIKQLIDYFCSGNNSLFANKIEIGESNVRSYLNGTEPKFNVIEKICKTFAINTEWLILGIGDMEKEKESKNIKLDNRVPQIVTIDSYNHDNIALVPQTLKAGYITGYNDPTFIKQLPAYRMPGLNNGIFRMFEVEGNSMFPTLPNKSYVVGQFIDDWEKDIKDNKIYAIISNEVEDGIIKRCINRISKYDNLICKSDNRRNFPTQNINPLSIKEVWEVKLHLNFQLPDPADIYDRMDDLEAELQEVKRRVQ
ncbi:transcriptional regulator [Chryseobacterium sp. KBW03]|uniref:LexA family transcriptional regulator n=1 Tax=Chryseobacterium sp. KBW03 TaxID=2153362 RepID=UPI000F5AB93F|nr:S24 family peptidase [Chryseobacterium sp. KBW03]RQO37919.1 transcriptional regulator [Chryseobacterium sp. KBW03]